MGKIKFLGIGSAFNPLWGNNAAYYKKDSNLLLIDCGETNFERILKFKILEDIKEVDILITHLHPDHVGSLGSLIFYLNHMMKIKPNIVFGDKDSIVMLLGLMGVSESEYTLSNELPEGNLKKLSVKKVEIKEIIHSDKLKSYGYKITFDDNKAIFYTGDCKELQQDIINQVIDGRIDELYIDCFPYDIKGVPHITIDKLCEIFTDEHRSKIYGMHYDGEEVIEMLEKNKFNIIKVEGEK